MNRPPEHITFTGVDDATVVAELVALSHVYPVEWGVLFSPTRQGKDPRYPAHAFRFLDARLKTAAHLCGDYSREIVERAGGVVLPDLRGFQRIQVNHPEVNLKRLADAISVYHPLINRRCVAQVRTEFPLRLDHVEWLYDGSGGRGLEPKTWPSHPGGEQLVGFAGGIGPDNVLRILSAIRGYGPYWIDMESGVRTGNRFDVALCRRVLEAVYGRR